MRQDRLVQHVRIGHHDVAMQADRLARITRGIAIEGEGLDAQIASTVEFQQLGHLVLCQRLVGNRYSALALSCIAALTTGGCSTAMPLAVGVTMATCSPRWLASQASAWWL